MHPLKEPSKEADHNQRSLNLICSLSINKQKYTSNKQSDYVNLGYCLWQNYTSFLQEYSSNPCIDNYLEGDMIIEMSEKRVCFYLIKQQMFLLNEEVTLGERGSGGRAKSSSSASCAPAGTDSEGRVPLYMWNLQWGFVAIANSSSSGNQSWESLATHNSTRRWVLLMMHLCEDKRKLGQYFPQSQQKFNIKNIKGTYVDLKLPAADGLIRQDLGEGDC